MSRPSFENIDQWLFEYTEGNLSPVQESQLMDFISLHPELISELKSWQQAKVTPKPTPAFSTAALVKPMPFYLHPVIIVRSEEHTSELQSRPHLVCRLLLEK